MVTTLLYCATPELPVVYKQNITIPKQTIILTLIGSLQPTKNTVTKVNTILTIKTKMKQITNYLLIK